MVVLSQSTPTNTLDDKYVFSVFGVGLECGAFLCVCSRQSQIHTLYEHLCIDVYLLRLCIQRIDTPRSSNWKTTVSKREGGRLGRRMLLQDGKTAPPRASLAPATADSSLLLRNADPPAPLASPTPHVVSCIQNLTRAQVDSPEHAVHTGMIAGQGECGRANRWPGQVGTLTSVDAQCGGGGGR